MQKVKHGGRQSTAGIDPRMEFVHALADWCAERACAQGKAATAASYRPLVKPDFSMRIRTTSEG